MFRFRTKNKWQAAKNKIFRPKKNKYSNFIKSNSKKYVASWLGANVKIINSAFRDMSLNEQRQVMELDKAHKKEQSGINAERKRKQYISQKFPSQNLSKYNQRIKSHQNTQMGYAARMVEIFNKAMKKTQQGRENKQTQQATKKAMSNTKKYQNANAIAGINMRTYKGFGYPVDDISFAIPFTSEVMQNLKMAGYELKSEPFTSIVKFNQNGKPLQSYYFINKHGKKRYNIPLSTENNLNQNLKVYVNGSGQRLYFVNRSSGKSFYKLVESNLNGSARTNLINLKKLLQKQQKRDKLRNVLQYFKSLDVNNTLKINLSANISLANFKRMYKRLALKYHPNKAPPNQKLNHENKFKKLVNLYKKAFATFNNLPANANTQTNKRKNNNLSNRNQGKNIKRPTSPQIPQLLPPQRNGNGNRRLA